MAKLWTWVPGPGMYSFVEPRSWPGVAKGVFWAIMYGWIGMCMKLDVHVVKLWRRYRKTKIWESAYHLVTGLPTFRSQSYACKAYYVLIMCKFLDMVSSALEHFEGLHSSKSLDYQLDISTQLIGLSQAQSESQLKQYSASWLASVLI